MNNTLLPEREYSYPIQFETPMFTPAGALMPQAYQRIFTFVLDEHLCRYGLDVPYLTERFGTSWVMLSLSLEVLRPIRRGDRLHINTWFSGIKPPVFRREFVICDETGAVYVKAAGFFALLDLSARRVSRDPALYAHCMLPVGETLLEAASRRPRYSAAFVPIGTRQVRPSWIDGLGHVNNTRYGEMTFDALPAASRARMGELTRMDIYMLHELREGDCVEIGTADGRLVCGTVKGRGEPVFVTELTFGGAAGD